MIPNSLPRAAVLAIVCVMFIAACGSSPAPTFAPPTTAAPVAYEGWPPSATFDLIPIPVSSELVIGQNRLLVNLIDNTNESVASADLPATLRFYDLATDAATPSSESVATYMPTVEGRPGLYRTEVNFDRAGDWGLEAVTSESDGSQRTGRMVFSVRETGTTPAIGDPAPASETPTAADEDEIAQISTDDDPDSDFYRESIADALAAGEPFAVVFATPAFCRTATCGPTLDVVKSVADYYKDRVTFIHVEPYQLTMEDGHLQPVLSDQNLPISVDATNEWGLPTEPYVFVVDRDGNVHAKFEGVAGTDELEQALSEVGGEG